MKTVRILVALLLVFAMTFGTVFAGNGNDGFKVGDLTEKSNESATKIAEKYANEQFEDKAFKFKKQHVKEDGLTTVRLQQYYNNVPVWGSEVIVNVSGQGIVKSFIGLPVNLDGKINKSISKKISKKTAVENAVADLKGSPVLLEDPKAELVVYNMENGTSHYAYFVELVYEGEKPGRDFYFMDAETGEVLHIIDMLLSGKQQTNVTNGQETTGRGTDVLGNTRYIDTTALSGDYYLVDLTRGNGIYTMDAKSRTRLPGSYWIDGDNVFNSSYDAAAVSSQYNFAVTYDYFMNKFGRNSFDGNGAQITSSVHVGRSYNNAYWNGRQFAFGDGDGGTFIELSGALDVVAHEFTHAVTEYTAGLIYQNESGALNEAMSDIFGAAVEFYNNEDPDWLLGEDIIGSTFNNPALRSMADPTVCGDPDHYTTRYTGTQDNGGVHINSGIINKVAYLMAEGGTHYGVTVQGQGVGAMEDIFYRALTTYMTPSTNFAAAKLACEQAAIDLYGSNSSQVNAVTKAFEACGIN